MCFVVLENEAADGVMVEDLVDFLKADGDGKHNLLVFGDNESKRHIRKLVNHLGIDFEGSVSAKMIANTLTKCSYSVTLFNRTTC